MRDLGERLEAAYGYLRRGWAVWDFCCDHGELGRKALASGLFETVHFVDRAPHLVARIQAELAEGGDAVAHEADVCKADLGATGNLVFFGIGAKSMMRMLETQCPAPAEGVRLVLCPNKEPEALRMYLRERGWRLRADTLVRDSRSIKEVMVCEREGAAIELFGNGLRGHEMFGEYVQGRVAYYRSLPVEAAGREEMLPVLERIVGAGPGS